MADELWIFREGLDIETWVINAIRRSQSYIVSQMSNLSTASSKSNRWFLFLFCICVRDSPKGSSFLYYTLCCVAGMLLMGFTLRNIPVITDGVYIDFKWSASLRNIALAIILTRAGLGLDPTVCYILHFSSLVSAQRHV